jgi:hypothetical protein
MPIEYYPDDQAKRKKFVVEKLQEPEVLYSLGDSWDLTSAPQSAQLWFPGSWEIRRVTLHWAASTSKSYSASVCRGRGIVKGKNDRLFFKADGINEQEILLTQGFYTGATLAAELKAQLDANTAFQGIAATPFTVSYASGTGLFRIAANGALPIQYFYQATALRRLNNYSSAGRDLGLTQDTALAASISSDTAVKNLGVQLVYLGAAGNTSKDIFGTDTIAMSVDDAFDISLGQVATTGDFELVYRVLDS